MRWPVCNQMHHFVITSHDAVHVLVSSPVVSLLSCSFVLYLWPAQSVPQQTLGCNRAFAAECTHVDRFCPSPGPFFCYLLSLPSTSCVFICCLERLLVVPIYSTVYPPSLPSLPPTNITTTDDLSLQSAILPCVSILTSSYPSVVCSV